MNIGRADENENAMESQLHHNNANFPSKFKLYSIYIN